MATKPWIYFALGVLLLVGILAGTKPGGAGAVWGNNAGVHRGQPPTTSEIEAMTRSMPSASFSGSVLHNPAGSVPAVGELPAMLAAETLLLNGSISLVNLPLVVR